MREYCFVCRIVEGQPNYITPAAICTARPGWNATLVCQLGLVYIAISGLLALIWSNIFFLILVALPLSLLLLSNHGFCYANSYSLRSSGTCLDVITWKWDWPDPFFRPCLNPQCIFSKECAVLVVIKSKELWGRSCSCLYYYSDVIVVPDGRLLMTSQLSMQMDFLTALHTLCPRCSASSKTNF